MMKSNWIQTLLVVSGLMAGSAMAGSIPGQNESSMAIAVVGSDWVVQSENAVCGVSEAHQISNPAKVDYEALMKVTPEMKELRKNRIDKTSARGQTLVTAARDRVRRAASSVMKAKGHCSVWKEITHKKKQKATDLTSAVKAKLES